MSSWNVSSCLSYEEIWGKTVARLQTILDRESWNRFIAGLVPLEYDQQTKRFILGALNEFLCSWLEANYRHLIVEALKKETGEDMNVEFRPGYDPLPVQEIDAIPVESSLCLRGKDSQGRNGEKTVSLRLKESIRTREIPLRPKNLRPDFTFDTFVVGDNNRVCVAAARAVADNPGKSYNPLFIYGGCGLGKTHLLQAIANEVLRNNPYAEIEYLTSEEFVNLYVEAVQTNKTSEFRRRFRNVDLLLIDDVQCFKGKVGSTEEFFHTFNTLYNAHKQIVLVADRTPQETGLEDRIVSRFAWGLPAEILPPNFETRLAILRKKQERQEIQLPNEVLELIASRIQSNIRNLESALTLLIMNVSAMGVKMTVELAEKLLMSKFEVTAPREVRVEDIQKVVANYFDVRLSDLLGNKRPKDIAMARMVAMYLTRKLTDHSFPVIAQHFNRNHATVLHAVETIQQKIENDERLRQAVHEIERKLKN